VLHPLCSSPHGRLRFGQTHCDLNDIPYRATAAECGPTSTPPLFSVRRHSESFMSPIKIMAGSPASASKANGVNEDMKRSNGTLVDEMKRSSGEQK
jgi:hypothetical protein